MKRSGFQVMSRLLGLVKPLTGYMLLAITMGLIGHLCATFITVFGGFAVLHVLHPEWSMSIGVLFAAVLIFALVRKENVKPCLSERRSHEHRQKTKQVNRQAQFSGISGIQPLMP